MKVGRRFSQMNADLGKAKTGDSELVLPHSGFSGRFLAYSATDCRKPGLIT